ncbi:MULTISPECIES: orotate phosphoribosyltransferase [Ignavibacterium]|jgi:orotate phosphoribosyltransferase|uniref:orotate phosphoribosyltransferase n=1 Tax=Ignavibacterium TaxID=795750 RepID=UPI0025C61B45|nr:MULTISPECIES: orotate phosphoribosyltransferase [Ignavibacterium]MBI5661345.1 orotate phosphoribosyltransferase [Ignavibacterium album]
MSLTDQQIFDIFIKTNALLHGHFLLTSGRHSNQYFQCAKVLQYPNYTSEVCSVLSEYFRNFDIDTVIAPAMGGIIVGYEVARQLGKRSIFTERENNIMTLRRGFTLLPDEKVLVCEDVVTTGGSVFEVIDIVRNSGAKVIGVASVVDRSNGKVNFDYPFKSALQLEAVSYSPDECPVCVEGKIPLVKPGSRKVL